MSKVNYFLKAGRKTLWQVELDGAVLGVIPQDKLFAICSRQGDVSPSQELELRQEAYAFAKERVLRYLSYQERCEKQSLEYLIRLPLNMTIAEDLVREMSRLGFINQERFAYSFARSLKAKNIAKGLAFLRMEYFGLEFSLCEEALAKVYKDELSVVELAVQKAVKKYGRFPKAKMKQKCLAWLHRRGFRFEQVAYLLGKKIAESSGNLQ